MDARNRKCGVSHPSYSLWEQKPHGQEFSRTFSIQQSRTATTNIRSFRTWKFFRKQGGKQQPAGPLCKSDTTLGNALDAPVLHKSTREVKPRSIVTNFTCKDTIATCISEFPMEMVELWTLHLFRCDMNWEHHRQIAFTIEIWQYMYFFNFSN